MGSNPIVSAIVINYVFIFIEEFLCLWDPAPT